MNAPLKSRSAGMEEWLEATRGWTISAYVESGDHADHLGVSQNDVSQIGQPRPAAQQRRQEWPFGENIREVIRAVRGQ